MEERGEEEIVEGQEGGRTIEGWTRFRQRWFRGGERGGRYLIWFESYIWVISPRVENDC